MKNGLVEERLLQHGKKYDLHKDCLLLQRLNDEVKEVKAVPQINQSSREMVERMEQRREAELPYLAPSPDKGSQEKRPSSRRVEDRLITSGLIKKQELEIKRADKEF
jgi:hypothetical protein